MSRLMKVFCCVLVVLLPACCIFRVARHPLPRQTQIEIIESKTVALVRWVAIVGQDEEGDPIIDEVNPEQHEDAELRVYCAGVWVNDDTFLTAEHCVEDLGKPSVDSLDEMLRELLNNPRPAWDPTGQPALFSMFGDVRDGRSRTIRSSRSAVVVAVDPKNDLALIRAVPDTRDDELPSHPIARIADETRVGDVMHIVGHPSGLWWSYTRGYVAQFRPNRIDADKNHVDAIQISAPVWFGNSGGGAFNEEGELVGIASWIQDGPSQSFFIDFTTIRRFLAHQRIR